MGNNVSLANIVDQLYALKPDERSKAFDELCEKHKCIKSYLLSKWKPERENKPRLLTVKKVVDKRDKLNSKDCTKWKQDPVSFWSPSYTLISKEDVHSPLAFAFDATILSVSKGHEECTRQRYISLFWYDYFREKYGEKPYDKEYTDVGRNIQTATKKDIESIITTLQHRVKTGRKFDKLAARFGDGILLTIPSSVSRSTLEQYLPLHDSAFEVWIEPLVGSPWEKQAKEPEVDSAGQVIRRCLLQKTSTERPSTERFSTKRPSTKPPSTKRPRSNNQSGSSLPESQQAYELEPNSKRHKTTNHNNNAPDKGHGTTTESAVQSRMAVQNLLLDHSSPESSNSSVLDLGYSTSSSANGFHNQTIGVNTGSQGTYDTLETPRTGFRTGYEELQLDQVQQNMELGIRGSVMPLPDLELNSWVPEISDGNWMPLSGPELRSGNVMPLPEPELNGWVPEISDGNWMPLSDPELSDGNWMPLSGPELSSGNVMPLPDPELNSWVPEISNGNWMPLSDPELSDGNWMPLSDPELSDGNWMPLPNPELSGGNVMPLPDLTLNSENWVTA